MPLVSTSASECVAVAVVTDSDTQWPTVIDSSESMLIRNPNPNYLLLHRTDTAPTDRLLE